MKELVGPRTLAMRPAQSIQLTTVTQGAAPATEQAIGPGGAQPLGWHRGRGTPETPGPLAAEAQLAHRHLVADGQVMVNVPSNE